MEGKGDGTALNACLGSLMKETELKVLHDFLETGRAVTVGEFLPGVLSPDPGFAVLRSMADTADSFHDALHLCGNFCT